MAPRKETRERAARSALHMFLDGWAQGWHHRGDLDDGVQDPDPDLMRESAMEFAANEENLRSLPYIEVVGVIEGQIARYASKEELPDPPDQP